MINVARFVVFRLHVWNKNELMLVIYLWGAKQVQVHNNGINDYVMVLDVVVVEEEVVVLYSFLL
jgi:hypothetical protein